MKKNKWYTISVFIIICVLLNLAGKCIAGYFRLPLWLDSLGTVAATYVCGPVCGVIVGVTLNILYSIIYSWTYACYAIVSVSIAVVAGICISKDYMKTLLGALTSSFYIALVSCSISVIFNYMFFKINIEIYSFLKILFIETIYNVLLIIIVYPLMKATGYEIENEIKGDRILTRYF